MVYAIVIVSPSLCIHFLTALFLPISHVRALFSPMHTSSVYIASCADEIECSSLFQFARGSQAVGLTAWEATANLSLTVYLLYATIHELRHTGTEADVSYGGWRWMDTIWSFH